jgi:hypothetical protein
MNFLRLNHHLKLVKDFGKTKHTVSTTCQHQGVVGPADGNVDLSPLTSQQSMGTGGQWVLQVSHTMSLTRGAHASSR